DEEAATSAGERAPRGARQVVRFIITAVLAALLIAGGYFAWQKFGGKLRQSQGSAGAPFATQQVSGLTLTLSTTNGQLQVRDNQVAIEFRNVGGELVDAGTAKLDLDMNMPGMVMHSGGEAERVKMGSYRTKIKPDMAGDWTARLSFDGPARKGETSFPVNVKQ
ncbi:MAG TPA: FixH family protein, partial [Casimicrobiaceae bacterium]|nr:FixH family protein [Casimicrobiaceae bacterium]